MRTAVEIETEIATLKALLTKVPSRNYFGDSNLDKIEAQIETLEELYTDNDVYDRFDGDLEPEFDDNGEEIEMDSANLDSAQDACRWLWDGGEAPSVGWQTLVKE